MSESTYFKIKTRTNSIEPEKELSDLLHVFWDAWALVELVGSNELDKGAVKDAEHEFNVIISELGHSDSPRIIEKVLKRAKKLNIEMTVDVVYEF